jgi:hypothetical protein
MPIEQRITTMPSSYQECSEIHTIQIFREATESQQQQYAPPKSPTVTTSNKTVESSSHLTMTPIAYQDTEIKENLDGQDAGIGSDWAIEMDHHDEDDDVSMMMDANVELPEQVLSKDTTTTTTTSPNSLYSFYFEMPLLPMVSEKDLSSTDDFTITSHDTESFHDNTGLNLTTLQDSTSFWETGLAPTAVEEWCMSPAHVSATTEERGSKEI